MANYGKLIVQAVAAQSAYPVPDALVLVREATDNGMRLIASLRTDEDGLTDPLEIEAPPESQSLSPGLGKAYTAVNIEVQADGFMTDVKQNAQIYSGVTSLQIVNLIPLPDSDRMRYPSIMENVTESSPPEL
ncbi:MAG: hypothetical protein IJR55_02065 [Clostridia bacterium]|nr:hypothetical protein [Clostridia bacterium]